MTHRYLAAFALALASVTTTGTAVAASQSGSTDSADQKLKITHEAERPTRTDLTKYFTGQALVNPLFSAEDDSKATSAVVTFEPGARTNWHTHPVGQQLVVTDGVGWVQIEGQPKRTIRAGDVVWIPADVKHWHGASADHSMTHIAIQERRDGSNVHWLGPVSDAEYQAD